MIQRRQPKTVVLLLAPRFETVSAFAGECLPALTRPNVTEAGLTFSIGAAAARDANPTTMNKIAAISWSLAMLKIFSTRPTAIRSKHETSQISHRSRLAHWVGNVNFASADASGVARRNNLLWYAILGSEIAQGYKP